MALHARSRALSLAQQALVDFQRATGVSAVPAIALDAQSVGMSRCGEDYSHLRGAGKVPELPATYCRASGIFSTARQAGGNCAMVIGGFGFGGSVGGFGCSVES